MSATEIERAHWYLTAIVMPTVADCVAQQADERIGILAALSVDNLVEYMFWIKHPARRGRGTALKAYRKELAERSRFYAVVREIATASKHVELEIGNASRINPASLEAVKARTQEVLGLGHGASSHGTLPDLDGMFRYCFVFVSLREGPEWVLHGVVQEATWFLTRELADMSGYRPTPTG